MFEDTCLGDYGKLRNAYVADLCYDIFFFGNWGCQLARHVACAMYFVTFVLVNKLGKKILYEKDRQSLNKF